MALMLGRSDILAVEDVKTEVVPCPEWGGEVLVRGMTGASRDAFEASVMEQKGRQMIANPLNFRAKLVVRCVVDEDLRPIFTVADADALGEKNAAVIDRIYEVAARLSGIGDRDAEKMMQDFGQATSNGSSSASPDNSASPSENSSPQ